ncbi:MAG: hypothetical protein RR219_02925 [Clostridiales bacterium]
MDWDSWSDMDKTILKESKNWFNWGYYGLSAIPLLVGTFLGAYGGDLRFFPLILLVFILFLGKTAISIFALLQEREGKKIIYCPYVFESSKLPFGDDVLRFIGYLSFILSVIFGFVLCIVSGFGLLSFGILAVVVALAFIMGYGYVRPGVDLGLSFFSQGVLITLASYYAQSGNFAWSALAVSLPIGFMVSALVLRSELAEKEEVFSEDIIYLPQYLGKETAERLFTLLFALGYTFIVLNVFYGVSGFWSLGLLLLLPLVKKGIFEEAKFLQFYWKFGLIYAFCLLLHFTF